MFNLFNKCKVYLYYLALIMLVSYIFLLKSKISTLEHDKQLLQAKIATYDIAIDAANEMRTQQQKQIKLREKEAAQARAESEKRRDFILHKEIQGGCEGANDFLIDYALGFHWDNTIP